MSIYHRPSLSGDMKIAINIHHLYVFEEAISTPLILLSCTPRNTLLIRCPRLITAIQTVSIFLKHYQSVEFPDPCFFIRHIYSQNKKDMRLKNNRDNSLRSPDARISNLIHINDL